MHKVIESICESLMHHSISQPIVAACAGDGTCGSHLLCSNAAANQAQSPHSRSVSRRGAVDSTPACAYVAGTLAPVV